MKAIKQYYVLRVVVRMGWGGVLDRMVLMFEYI
jgi:hypothetical protein